jgi:hypothetical protein
MRTRRDFLKGLTALASGLVLARRETLAEVARLGTPQQWVEPNVYTAIRSGRFNDPSIWDVGRVPTAGSKVVVSEGTRLVVDAPTEPVARLEMRRATVRASGGHALHVRGSFDIHECVIHSEGMPAVNFEAIDVPETQRWSSMIGCVIHDTSAPPRLVGLGPSLTLTGAAPFAEYNRVMPLSSAAYPWREPYRLPDPSSLRVNVS